MSDRLQQIKAAFERETLEAKPAVRRDDIPIRYDLITRDWLDDVICAQAPGARVASFHVEAAEEGNTSRSRISLTYNEAGVKADLPAVVFCKSTQRFASRVSVGISGGVHAEVTFYNHIRPQLDIEAPRGVWANYDAESLNSIVMLRDLGKGVDFCTLDTPMTIERVADQLTLLANFHGQFHQHRDLHPALSALSSWQEYFEKVKLIGLETLCAKGFIAARDVIPRRLFARAENIWPATLASVARHRALPHTLIHSDVHLRNWYVTAAGRMGLTDWQGACTGHWSRDVAYTIVTALPVDERRRHELALLSMYLERLAAAGGAVMSADDTMLAYRQELFPALAWWTVTLAPSAEMPDMQPRGFTLEMIRRITHAIDDLDALVSI